MKTLILALVAAAALPTIAAAAEHAAMQPPAPLVCRWEASQQTGIPIRLCLTRRQWEARTAYTQQWIREYQARSYVKM